MAEPISLVDVCRYYAGMPHQTEALKWLQSRVRDGVLEKFAEMWRSAPPQALTTEQLSKIYPYTTAGRIAEFLPVLNKYLPEKGIDTPLRLAHFLAQVGHESAGFQYTEELASGAAYEGRKDLGNTEVGDGVRFKGRGLIQLTGRSNYTRASKDLWGDDRYVVNPQIVATLPHSVLVTTWFWNVNDLSIWADRNDIGTITRIINGGYNGYEDRIAYFNRAKEAFGL